MLEPQGQLYPPGAVLVVQGRWQLDRGAQVDVDILRSYPNGTLAAHALGYTQPITESEFEILAEKGYKIRDRIGRTGVEAAYERHLRGKWGGQMLEVNAMGEVQRNLGDRPSEAGKDLVLTLDLDLQRVAEQALADKPGGAVVRGEGRYGERERRVGMHNCTC